MFYSDDKKSAVRLVPVLTAHVDKFIHSLPTNTRSWLNANDFKALSGQVCLVPNNSGELKTVYLGLSHKKDLQPYAKLPAKLPAGKYYFENKVTKEAAIFWGLAQYQFDRYKKKSAQPRVLVVTKAQQKELSAIVESTALTRTLINTPTEDMGPKQLSKALETLANEHDAQFSEIVGDELLKENFPAIHVVGRASHRQPRLLRMRWGNTKNPLICLVGKGVCFDSGGLDIKPSNGMRNMKKDMGGAAHVMGLAKVIMAMKLPLQIEVIIPAVENSIAGNAYRPGDVVNTRQGLTVEIGNTDAEGRVVLADALTLASELKPKLIIDFATLTGAARVAVGLDIAAMFSNNQAMATTLQNLGEKHSDPIWQLPLHQPYRAMIEPSIADLSNSGTSGYGGAITAALFLESFVKKKIPWLHFDVMAWNNSSRPGKPAGGEALALRAVYEYLKQR